MKSIDAFISACKYCRHYQPEGRRGGICHQLSVPVKPSWKACSLALTAFTAPWETLEEAWNLPDLPTIPLTLSTATSQNPDNLTPDSCEVPVTTSI